MHLLLCPAKLVGNTGLQNRHQFDLLVKDFEAFISSSTRYGGRLMGDIQEEGGIKKVGLYIGSES